VDHNNQNTVVGRSVTEERATAFVRAVEFVFRPIARMLVRRGIGISSTVDLIKRAYLAGAADAVKEQGFPVTVGRLSMYTGISRTEVERIRRQVADSVDLSETRFFKITRLFTTWHLDHRYAMQFVDTPRDLPVEARPGEESFNSLVQECAPGVDPKELLSELVHIRAVSIHPETGRVHLEARAYIPEPYEITDSERFGRMLGNYAITLDINSRKEGPGLGRFDRHVSADFSISEEDVAKFHAMLRERCQELLVRCDEWLRNCKPVEENGKRVGLATFFYVENDVNPDTAGTRRGRDDTGSAKANSGTGVAGIVTNRTEDDSDVIDTLNFVRGKKRND